MPEYGEVGFTLSDIKVAALASDNTYGTPGSLEYGQKLEFSPQADTDMIKAYGMAVELLAVVTHCTGAFDAGLIDDSAYQIIAGNAVASAAFGTTPNQYNRLDVQVGQDGLPYFGLIGKLFGVGGADLHVGFAKCKLDSMPGFTIEQNKFVLPSTAVSMITPDVSIRKLVRIERHETAEDISSDFDTWFASFFS